MNIPLPQQVLWALDRLETAGYAAYAVGGCVRDWVLGRVPHEYDLSSAATPRQVHEVFQGERLIDTGIQHGTVTLLKDGLPMEITTFRADGTYSDGRHPDQVRYSSSIEEDLKRRDFTCNAMAYSPVRGFVDPFSGEQACHDKRLAAVGHARERFEEDALRILRAMRFASSLGFTIVPDTAAAMRSEAARLDLLSRERVGAECNRMLLGDAAAQTLEDNEDIFRLAVACTALVHGEEWAHGLRMLPMLPKELPLRWAALMSQDKELAAQCMRHLRQSNAMQQEVSWLAANRQTPVTDDTLPRQLVAWHPGPMRKLLTLQRTDRLTALPSKTEDAQRLMHLADQVERLAASLPLSLAELAVKGKDLADIGCPPGPRMGETLQWLHGEVLDGRLPNERTALLEAARANVQSTMKT